MADWGKRFERLLDHYRLPDGSRWTGGAIERATRGAVRRNYVSALRTGKIANPSFEKLDAIARAMGFPVAAWGEDGPPGGSGRFGTRTGR